MKNTGTPALESLLIVFVVLKLTHVINWSWWWVLSPLWASLALIAIYLVAYFVYANSEQGKMDRLMDALRRTSRR